MSVVVQNGASARPIKRSRHFLREISVMAFAAGMAMPQPLQAADVTITSATAGSQFNSITLDNFLVANTATVTAASISAAVYNSGTIGTLTNQGKILNPLFSFFGLRNTNYIGSIGNSGTISGLGAGILLSRVTTSSTISPVVGALTNSGVISGGSTGAILIDGGTIGTLTNSGTIKGPYAILIFPGAATDGIGTIVNSGLIAGNIRNDANALTIKGGTLSTIGTLTGSNTTIKGTLASSADIVFASGNLLLNDNISAAGHAVSNIGAALTLTTVVGVSGTYSQSAGKLVLGTAGRMSITGAASITGGTILATIDSGGNYIAGSAISTLVQASGTSNYTGVNITTTLTSLNSGFLPKSAGTTSGNNLLLVASNDYIGGTLATLNNTGTISGAAAAVVVNATGSIGTLSNSGTLSGNTRGISVENGQIGTLTNQGRIVAVGGAGAAGGIVTNFGSIGSIVNTGTIISGASSGIGVNQNTSSIGQITNSGLISAATGAIYTQGTLGTVINTGTMTGGQGISINGGTVGLINNSGLFSGVTAILVAAGTLGSVSNSGVIAGKIDNRTANAITISGGIGATIGTLTGRTLTNQGSIVSTLANVVLAGGNLLLNDNVNVTGRTLVNNGATVYLNAIDTVTGAYSQTSGTLVVAPTQGGLIVSGGATIAGTVLSTFASTGNYLQGNYTLVSGSSLGLGSASVTIGALTGLYKSSSTVGNKLLLSIANDYVGGTLATLANAAALTGGSTGLYVATTGSIGTVTNSGTFGGAQFGVNNLGTIATLSNSGLITNDSFTALWNQGSIGRLVNTGTITNNSWAILNDGTIGTLTNSGVISGNGNAIQNSGVLTLISNSGTMSGGSNAIAGTMGTIANSGVIRGNINSSGGIVGTIIGGSGGTIGTFTGYSGGTQGTLGASADLTFASGALLLNDTILAKNVAASGLTVSNVGASIGLSTIVTIDANYRQTAGTLDLGSGKLVVTQAATFSGGTIAASAGGVSATGTYLVGGATGGTLVAGGAGSSYSGASIAVSGGITGLKLSSAISGTNLLLAAGNDYIGDNQATFTNSSSISGATYALYVANTGTVGTLLNSGTLSGSATGLNTNGSIGTLSNSGRISGGQKGLGNQSTIGLLINAAGGTILGGTAAGLQNDTSIGTLTNAGYISSGSAGFANYGTMGFLTNTGTITGGPQAIYNSGDITGTLANSGTISAPQSAIGLAGSVTALVNSGVIGLGTNGVNVQGTLGTLINQAGGTISGVSAIYSSGTIGGLSNSGLIKGNIRNDTANALTISGGAAGTIGTLTGQSGKGTITSTLSNLVFASGNLLLNDNIVATGRTVSNTGATLSLATIVTVTGNYSQSSGTLSIDPTQAGLSVSGTAAISGGTVQSSFSSTGNYLQNSYTLVSASSLNLAGATVSTGTVTGLGASVSTVSNKLLLSITNDYVGGTLATLANAAALTSANTGLYVATTGSIGTVTNSGTLGGGQFGVNNRGTIATLSNSGRITNANFTAVWNQGSIGRLVNTGTITNSSWAILNSGTIGTITNSGVISGAGVAIQNNAVITLISNSGTLSGGSNAIAGTIGTIANSGVIRGNINSSGGIVGTIIGGSGGTIGTFTGASGTTQGTIGASGNLTFASGALLLNDTILAVGTPASSLTVSNTGASIALATIVAIGGNYQQTAGTLDLGGSGKLVVTQAATFSGGTIATSIAGLSSASTYLVGGGAGGTLVAGGAGSSYSGVSITQAGSITGLKFATATSGTNLVLAAANDYIGDTQASIANSGTISGATYALYVASTGTVGTLVNSGVLSGSVAGLRNLGSIQSISNGTVGVAGTIVGGIGVANSGVIGTLVSYTAVTGTTGAGIDNQGSILALGNAGVIGGATSGIANSGTIGLFLNAGGIGGGLGLVSGTVGIANSGVIGTLSNTGGTIAGAGGATAYAVFNTATIGVLSNSGLIGGGTATNASFGIFNAGSITTLSNLAAGSITNSASNGSGIQNSGTVALVSNAGLISGGNPGLTNSGTITALNNSGTIKTTNDAFGTGLANSGTIGTLTNSGLIGNNLGIFNSGGTIGTLINVAGGTIGGADGIFSSGSIGTLSNSGTITGSSFGVYTSGTVGTLINAGRLVSSGGPALTITSTGSIGAIANTGVIQGNIVNASANALTITGGSVTLAGTLTGSNGHGLITNTASDLAFSSGYLVLNDDINVGPTHTVTNIGANLGLFGATTITGNYSQTTGGLYLFPGGGNLVVSGAASLTGGSIVALLSGAGNYLAGDSAVLVAGGTGSDYSGVGFVNGLTGLNASATVSGTSLLEAFANDYVGGSLATLSNTGALSSPTAIYIASSGSLGSLVNSGTIAGNILNLSANGLTIGGGINGTIGTLTGQSGQGTITSTLANVELASGSLLLNDAVNVGTGTLVNSGAAVALTGVVSVTGSYSQTAGTLSLASGAGKLVVSGEASLSGGTIALTGLSATANYLVGASAGTVVQGGAGSSYTGLSYTANFGGLILAGATQGNDLLVNAANYFVGGTLGAISNAMNLSVQTAVFVSATGVLGTLVNTGSLTGQVGVVNLGSIGSIANAGIVSVNGTAILNANQIGTIVNTGSLLAAASAAIYNSGTIAAIVNSGVVYNGQIYSGSGHAGAIVNERTIGALTNSGTITGPTAIYNQGALGTIANSGVIAGDIVNRAAQDIVFTGGTGGAVGTLAGYFPNAQGKITNTLGNVVLASGDLVLDDAVDVGTGTLINGGASVQLLNNVSVTGNYAQASGTLALGLSSLLVSGVASISGGLITTNQLDSTANYLAGSGGGTLVQGGAGSSYTGVAIASGITGLSIASSIGTIGANVDLLLTVTNDYVGGTLANLVNSGTIAGVVTAAYVASTGSLGTLVNSGLLDGTLYGLRNRGAIGLVDNSGTMTGMVGLYNSGTIGTVLNTGSLIDAPAVVAAGLNNSGLIGVVINQGIISGSARGLYNTGTIGRVTNSGTIAGLLAFYNGGSIGTLDNSGVLVDSAAPTSAGLNNAGQLAVLLNSGTISGATYGLLNSGTIGAITNSGLITAAIAIQNEGTLGAIANSGVIAGNIVNLAAQTLSITGGTGNQIGTLTGFGGAHGTITSATGDVVFSSGTLLLNDDFVATGHTVSNSGAVLGLFNNATITGDYSQTSGWLFLESGAKLIVSGAASFTGGMIAGSVNSAANYLAGGTAGTLVVGGTGSSYTGAHVVLGATPGLALNAGASGTNLVVTALNDYVGANLASLSNTGSLSADYAVYVATTGSLGSLTNSGTLSGAIAAIHNEGMLGPITNSGLIAGNIDNLSAQALSISGGTLTGYAAGSQGTITSTLGNVVLAGSIALNDAIDVGTKTVVNDGGSLALASTVNVTGNFSQSSGLLTLDSGAMLAVSGAASFTGGTIATAAAGDGNYIVGGAGGTLVHGGTGSSYEGVTVSTGSRPGLDLGAQVSGTDLVLAARNDYIGGSLGSLTNSGSLSADYAVFVATTGSLGGLTNNGTLSGSVAAIHNEGALGPITNSGVIAGNIDNLSAQALSISGGTLTGYAAGSQGTITNTLGNVVLAGNIALNDAINVGNNTVVNDGGSLALANSVAVTGNFSQSSGAITLGTGAVLNVGGTASFTGGTVLASLPTAANYLAGSAAGTLVQGGAGSTYTGVNVATGSTPGLALSAGASGTNLVVTALNDYVGADLASLTNSGSLSADYAVYVASTGSLGSLANSGTLSGAIAAIHNEGALGPITNSGVIAGNIDNLSAQTLSISGGTLTGYATGTQGTITSTGGNVVLAGSIALNDAINVGGNTVINNGGSLALASTVNVTGNFSQSSGLLTLDSGAMLAVSGAASFTGGTIATAAAGDGNYIVGGAGGTLVHGGTGSSYDGVTVSTGARPGLDLGAQISGTDLVLAARNDYIGGSLGSLTNSGSLSADYAVYVAATGSLGSLTNTGTLSGSIAAIHNEGALGPITNSGVIAGNIDNLSAQALSISGGAGTGTLTGFGGARGTITSTRGDVVFAAGNLLLNDDIVATGHVVSNNGAVLNLASSASITGGYSQSAGSLVLASGAQLAVSGVASLTGGTVAASLPTAANYLAGSIAGTLVQGGAGSSYTGVSVSTGATPGLALGAGASGTNLVVTARNNYVGATLASLTNSGTLTADYPVYVASTGSLGSLTNSGTLSGAVAAIHNGGLIGPITNTGVIAGNIESSAAADLAITGGSGTAFGTLTGFAAGSQGTISNTGGNVVLTGNLLLNDAINVGSRNVNVNGGSLALNNAVAITGNYSQTGGKLLIGVTSTAAYGQLLVSGSASLTGANVTLVTLGTGTIAAGQAYTVVKANGALTYSSLTSSVTGLNGAFSTIASGGATGLVLTLSGTGTITPPPTTFTPTGVVAGGPGVGTGAALDAIIASNSPAAAPVITNVLLPLALLPLDQQERGIIQLAPTQLTPQVIAVAVSPALNAIVQHQDVLAANVSGREERGLSAGSQGQQGSVWGQFLINSAKRDNVAAASPYKASSYGVMVGADVIGTSSLIVGGAVSWVNSTANGRAEITGSRTTLNSFQGTAYFTWRPGDAEMSNFAIDGQLGFGYNHYKQRRRIDFLHADARASYDGQQYLGNLRASYTIPAGKTASVMPFAGIREVHVHNAGYSETGASSANLQVSHLDVDSLSHEIGVQAAGIFDTASGRFAPMLKLGWVHNYTNGPIPLSAVLGGVAFTSTSARGARDGAAIGAGLSFLQNDRFRIGVQYDGELRRDFKSHSGTVKMTFNF